MKQILPYLLLIPGGMFLTLGDIAAKQWIVASENRWLLLTLALWNVGLVLLAWSFRFKNIAIASAILVIANIITLAFASWWLFNEPLSKKQLIGMTISIVGIAVMELE
ncbi:MAG: hypothetical protein FJX76_02005 [Armatimonadetes bacterium]|nr:hypothetical protein [Armatimonadota bacterium]